MAIVINGSGTVTGLAVGGLPDGTVDSGTIATGTIVDADVANVAASKLTGKYSITELDDYSVRSLPVAELSFSEIKNFKGLESDVIVLIELPHPKDLKTEDEKVLHYVAMSRARALLSIIWN